MPRLFVGIDLPDPIDAVLALAGGGIPGARWQPSENLHLTLRFIGEVDGGLARRIDGALADVQLAPFSLAVAGVGVFPLRGPPRVVWAGVADRAGPTALRHAIDRALDPLDVPPDPRKFHPHVTLARLSGAPESRVAAFVATHALLALPPFSVEEFALYSSVRTSAGSRYRIEASYPLSPP